MRLPDRFGDFRPDAYRLYVITCNEHRARRDQTKVKHGEGGHTHYRSIQSTLRPFSAGEYPPGLVRSDTRHGENRLEQLWGKGTHLCGGQSTDRTDIPVRAQLDGGWRQVLRPGRRIVIKTHVRYLRILVQNNRLDFALWGQFDDPVARCEKEPVSQGWIWCESNPRTRGLEVRST